MLKKKVFFLFNTITLLLLLAGSCDTGIKPEENNTQFLFNIAVSSDSTGTGYIDASASSMSGRYDVNSVLTAQVLPPGTETRFDGWYTAETGGIKKSGDNPYSFILTEDTSLYARFDLITYYSFNTGTTTDGSGSGSIDISVTTADDTYEKGTAITAQTLQPEQGSRFSGWYSSETGGIKISGDNPYNFYLDSDISLYAHFEEMVPYPAVNPDLYDPGDTWTLAWSDEFNDDEFNSDTWDRQVMLSPYNGEWEKYTGAPATAYEENGYMIIQATYDGPENEKGNYTSARVISNPGGSTGDSGSTGKIFKYGKIAARIQLPYGRGIWPAFWLLGDNSSETGGDTDWPSCGEIDILETGSQFTEDNQNGHATAGQAIHYDYSVDNSSGYNGWEHSSGSMTLPSGLYADQFHVFEIEWNSSQIIWKIDGVTAHSENITADYFSEFHENFYLIFNIAVGGTYTGRPDGTTPFPQYMYIDWVRHYTN